MNITLLMDNPDSWYYFYCKELESELIKKHNVSIVRTADEISEGDIVFFLSCEKIIHKDVRKRNKHNIVVHSSDLPEGKGWSPLTWHILEGRNTIVNSLFEAEDMVDSGCIYLKNTINFEGHELIDELHKIQAEAINKLILQFVDQYPNIIGKAQEGEETYYRRRNPKDRELNIHKTIIDQFNHLRISDNEKYPAFFRYRGYKYILKISKAGKDDVLC